MAPGGLLAVSGELAAGLLLAGAAAGWLALRLRPASRLRAARRRLARGDHRAALDLVGRLRP